MAIARPQPGGAPTGIKVALIVFIVLTLASLTFAIIHNTYQEDLNHDVENAQASVKRAGEQSREAQDNLRNFAKLVIGEFTDDPSEIKQAIDSVRQQILNDPRLKQANITQDVTVLTLLGGIYDLYARSADDLAKLDQLAKDLNAKLQKLTQETAATEKAFADKTKELESQYANLVKQNQQHRKEWEDQITKLTTQLEQARTEAANVVAQEREKTSRLEKTLAEREKLINEYKKELAKFQPSGDQLAALQTADGRILKIATGADIVYIDVGRQHGIKRGLTFSVYSKVRPISEDGKGKATIEVDRVFDTTSECKVTSVQVGEPIVTGDIVANPVFDRNRQFNFAVAGDFDLDFDGKIDDPNGIEVQMMIKQWGGKIVREIDTRTDFIVLGAAPPLPRTLPENAAPELVERNAEREKDRQAFDNMVDQAKALSIPILTRTQFLHFVGFGVPSHIEDDRPIS